MDTAVEDSTSGGWLDMSVRFNGNVYLFEFKVVETSPKGEEKKQLKARGYADKYRGLRQPFHLIAVEFSKSTRNLFTLEVERT